MRLTVQQADLARALTLIDKVVLRKSSLQFLEGVLMIADGQYLTLVGTDLSTGAVYRIPAIIEEGGSCLIQAARFTEFIETLSPLSDFQSDPLTLEQDPEAPDAKNPPGSSSSIKLANRLHVSARQTTSSGRTWSNHASLVAWSPEDFPTIPLTAGQQEGCDLSASALKRALAASVSCTERLSRHSGHWNLTAANCVLLRTQDQQLQLLASNGPMLSLQRLSLVHTTSCMSPRLFEGQTLAGISRLLPNEGSIRLSVTEEERTAILFFAIEQGGMLFCRSADLPLPEYSQTSDFPHETEILVERKDLQRTLKAATALEKHTVGRPHIAFAAEAGQLRLASYPEDPEAEGSGDATLPITLSGKPVNTLLIWSQFKLLLEKVGTTTVRLQLGRFLRNGEQQAFLRIEPIPPDGSLFMMGSSFDLTAEKEAPNASKAVDHTPVESVAGISGGDN